MPGEFDDTAWECEQCKFSKDRSLGINRPMNRKCEVCNSDAPARVRSAQDELKRVCDATIRQAGGKKNKRKTRRTRH